MKYLYCNFDIDWLTDGGLSLPPATASMRMPIVIIPMHSQLTSVTFVARIHVKSANISLCSLFTNTVDVTPKATASMIKQCSLH